MRLKYYLRGMGIGITFATLILTISFYFGKDTLMKEKLTDEQIIEKATALGMVMPEEDSTEAGTEDVQSEEGDLENEDNISLDSAIQEVAENPINTEDTCITYVPFTVKGGQSSEMICKNLEKAGLIVSAEKFNKYLNQLNVDDLVKSGTFYIPEGSSYDDIVALLVNKETRTTTPPKAPEAPTAPEKPETPKAEE